VGIGELEASSIRILTRGNRWMGYALVRTVVGGKSCSEMLASTPEAEEALLGGVEGLAAGGICAFGDTPVRDARARLLERGYTITPHGWYPLMGKSLERDLEPAEAIREFGTDSPTFQCLQWDRF
jgi:hypothetical protein